MPKLIDLEAWSSEQLIALLLGSSGKTGDPSPAASETGAQLLCELGGVAGLARASTEDIEEQLSTARHNHVPPRTVARRVVAAFELGRRAATESVPPSCIASSADVAAWASLRLGSLDYEELWLLALDGRSRLRGTRCVARGGLHGMGVRTADPLRIALRAAASGFVLVHNHPSGDPTPSAEDISFTRRVAEAAAIIGMPLLDHVVVARDGFASVPFRPADSASVPAGAVEA